MRTKQAYISDCLSFFRESIQTRYKFEPYTNPNAPAVFYGMYPPKRHRNGRRRMDVSMLENHKSLAIVVWCGSDALAARTADTRRHYQRIRNAPNMVHVALSKSVMEDLTKIGIPCKHVPLCSISTAGYAPVPLGDRVYVYTSFKVPKVYGWHLVEKVRALLPDIKFEVHTALPPNYIPRSQLKKVYAKCFAGLRLTAHDGLSNTVVELGLMGRRCIWNGWAPNAIPWKTVQDAAASIRQEQSRMGEYHQEVADEMREFLKVGPHWLHPGFWGLTVRMHRGMSTLERRVSVSKSQHSKTPSYRQRKLEKKNREKLKRAK